METLGRKAVSVSVSTVRGALQASAGTLYNPQWSTWGPVRDTVLSTVVNKGAVRDSVQYTVVNMGGSTCTLSEWLLGREIR